MWLGVHQQCSSQNFWNLHCFAISNDAFSPALRASNFDWLIRAIIPGMVAIVDSRNSATSTSATIRSHNWYLTVLWEFQQCILHQPHQHLGHCDWWTVEWQPEITVETWLHTSIKSRPKHLNKSRNLGLISYHILRIATMYLHLPYKHWSCCDWVRQLFVEWWAQLTLETRPQLHQRRSGQ